MTICTLVFTDVVDSTQLVERVGDTNAAEIWAAHDRRARDLMAAHGGREIDRTDGFFLIFDAVADAAAFALGYQQAMAGLGLSARAGIHLGAVTLRENDAADVARGAKPVEVEGLAKPFAARVMALAGGGQTLLSATARDALAGALPAGAELRSLGHYRLKGVEAPAALHELVPRGGAGFAPPADADKAYRVVRIDDLWHPVREVRHNLPAERDGFVGRVAELRALAQRLEAGARLLTLLGPGGTGKTRLAIRYARAWLGDWPGGVYFCDLSEARSIEGVHFAVGWALGVPLGKDDPGVQIGHAIAARGRCLVLLDNFEQVVEHAAPTLGHWLDRAPEACFAVTSRERLHLPGEEVFAVEPLQIAADAIELFERRARAQQPGFAVGAAERPAVAEIVRLLDGLPLAIELAAARVRMLSPTQIVARLADRFRLLAGARGATARQATLRAAIDWSWDLLAPWEQAALAQCSVFEGGFTLDAAEQVLDLTPWPDAPPIIDAVQSLLDKSLLRHWRTATHQRHDIAEPYFGMYLSIHDYAAGKLEARGGDATRAAEQRHGTHFSRFGSDDALEALARHGGVARLRALTLELDNLVAACRRAVARRDGTTAVATLRATWEVLERQGPYALGMALGTQVLAVDSLDLAQRTLASLVRALAARRVGRAGEAQAWVAETLALSRESGDRCSEGLALVQLGLLCDRQGRTDEGLACFEQALALQRTLGNHRLEAAALASLANHLADQGRLDAAAQHLEAALALHREHGDRRAEGSALHNLAIIHHERGAMDDARTQYEAVLALKHELGDRVGEGIALGNLGTLHDEQGRRDDARSCYERALAINREVGDRPSEGHILGNLVELCADLGCLDEALAHQATALAIVREAGSRREEGVALGRRGRLLALQGKLNDATTSYEAALAILREVGNRHNVGSMLGDLGELLARQGRCDEALAALRTGEALLREMNVPLTLAALLCQRGWVELDAGDRAAAQAALAEAAGIAEALDTLPGSELGREIGRLRRALA